MNLYAFLLEKKSHKDGNVYYYFFPGPQGLSREWPQRERLLGAVCGSEDDSFGGLGSENGEQESIIPWGPQS